MNIEAVLSNKNSKPKQKTEELSLLLLNKELSVSDLIKYATTAKDPVKATCIEALEFATRQNPEISTAPSLGFVTDCLNEKAPRIKWESAKVVGNIARLYPSKLDDAVENLLSNTKHEGTVVRWSAAFALGEIIKLKTPRNKKLIPAVENICQREEKNSIKKIYLAALKKLKS